MSDNAHDVSRHRVDDGQAMDFVFRQNLDRIEQTVFRFEINEGTIVLLEDLSPGLDLVLLQLFNLGLKHVNKLQVD